MFWKIIAILLLLMHGFGHSMGLMPGWTKNGNTFTGTPWAIPFDSGFAKFWGFVWFAVVVIYIISCIGIFLKTGWWPKWLITGSILSLIVIAPWWNTMPFASKIGAVGMDIIILYLLLSPMREQIIKWAN
jgi:hypothetical protein